MMRRRAPTTFFFILLCLFVFGFFSIYYSRNVIPCDFCDDVTFGPANLKTRASLGGVPDSINHAIWEETEPQLQELISRWTLNVESIRDSVPTHSPVLSNQSSIKSTSVLLPGWEALIIVSPETPLTSGANYVCLFPSGETSPANFSGVLLFSNQTAFKCCLPKRNGHGRQLHQPVLTLTPEKSSIPNPPVEELLKWNFIVYESYSTEDDVVVFSKGLNNRQGINRSPDEFRCVFGEDPEGFIRTAVTSSVQEVFRCSHPNLMALGSGANRERIKVSLEIKDQNLVVPSVAYYMPRRKIENQQPKSLLCACTMVYNVAKFLREWVMYHSRIGVEKFILYDNDSDDDLQTIVKELNQDGYDVRTLFWVWPKTQEAGFSHAAIYAKDSCTWMMYMDVDEFVYAPSWQNYSQPLNHMLKSLLPRTLPQSVKRQGVIGQVSIKCNDFGPSNQVAHPAEGVTQGYSCRQRVEQRHKSIVLLDAIKNSLANAIHHFDLKAGYRWSRLGTSVAVVNHYKYQAWPEFKTKFRRRVSAYVVDWTRAVNLKSNDRTPGLGNEAVEPEDWPRKFCEVKDERLKLLTRKWFGFQTPAGQKMAWQR